MTRTLQSVCQCHLQRGGSSRIARVPGIGGVRVWNSEQGWERGWDDAPTRCGGDIEQHPGEDWNTTECSELNDAESVGVLCAVSASGMLCACSNMAIDSLLLIRCQTSAADFECTARRRRRHEGREIRAVTYILTYLVAYIHF